MVDVFADGFDEFFNVAEDAAAQPVLGQVERVRDWFLISGGSFSAPRDTTGFLLLAGSKSGSI
jgi:hypothetical protein